MSGWEDLCPVCREPLPARGNQRRAIPHLGGKRRLVHPGCALLLDRQLVLEDPSSGPWNRAARLRRNR